MPLFGKKPREKIILWEHKVNGIPRYFQFSTDSLWLAVGAEDCRESGRGEVWFFNRSGQLLWNFTAHDIVSDLSLSGDGSLLAVGSFDQNVLCLNRSGRILWSNKVGSPVRSVCVSSDGSVVAAGADDKGIFLFDRSGQLLWNHKIMGAYYDICFPCDGSLIVARAGTKIYALSRSGELLWNNDVGNEVATISISADGSLIVAGSKVERIPDTWPYSVYPGEVHLFDRQGNSLWRNRIDDSISDVTLSADGSLIAVGTIDKEDPTMHGNVVLFDRSGQLLWIRKMGIVRRVSFAADSSLIAPVADKLCLFDRSGQPIWDHELSGFVSGCLVSYDGVLLAAGSGDSRICLFDISKVQP